MCPQGEEPIGEVQTDYPKDLFYTKQSIGNACGTVAIVHALANNQNQIDFDGQYEDGKALMKFQLTLLITGGRIQHFFFF